MRKALGIVASLLLLALSADAADVSELIKKMKDKDPDVRRQAASALAEAGADAKPAVTVLTQSLKDSDVFVRRFSAQALGNIGPDAAAAIPALKAVMMNAKESKEVQEGAAAALGKMGKGGVDSLVAALKDTNKDPEIRLKAAESLGQMGADARGAIGALVDALKTPPGGGGKKATSPNNLDIRADVCAALGEIASAKDEAAVKALEGIAGEKKSKNKTLMTAAREALRKIKARK